ncbi:unnamed protein product, partial [Rotaria magnacalcarata]
MLLFIYRHILKQVVLDQRLQQPLQVALRLQQQQHQQLQQHQRRQPPQALPHRPQVPHQHRAVP